MISSGYDMVLAGYDEENVYFTTIMGQKIAQISMEGIKAEKHSWKKLRGKGIKKQSAMIFRSLSAPFRSFCSQAIE